MNQKEILEQYDKDFAEFQKYGFHKGDMQEIEEFYKAKKAYVFSPDDDTYCQILDCFQYAHSDLKSACASHIISPATLEELTSLLRKVY